MLNARKSWFFHGDAIVALGTGITCSNDDEVETVIQQVKLAETPEIIENEENLKVEILAGPNCAYILPDKPRIRVRTERRAGRWSDLRDGVPLSPLIVKPYWLALIPHGCRPENERYLVVYLPGMNAEKAAAWWAQRPFEVIQQDSLAHRILDRRTGEIQVVQQWVGARIEPVREVHDSH